MNHMDDLPAYQDLRRLSCIEHAYNCSSWTILNERRFLAGQVSGSSETETNRTGFYLLPFAKVMEI